MVRLRKLPGLIFLINLYHKTIRKIILLVIRKIILLVIRKIILLVIRK